MGKSQLLRDIVALLEQGSAEPIVLAGLELNRTTTDIATARQWLEDNAQKEEQPDLPAKYSPALGGAALTAPQFFAHLQQQGRLLGQARPFYCWFADAAGRIALGDGSLGTRPTMRHNPHPLARLYREGELEDSLSKLSQDVFDLSLTLDRVNGDVMLRVGEVTGPVPPLNRPTREYSDNVAKLRPLSTQGDGVKSFIGLALHVMAGDQPMVLIDEPEAFLHQSQAKALGRWLAKESQRTHRQVILATHDRNIVLGLLEGQAPITVLRLTREGSDSRLHQLPADELSSVWADPVLRYSNVLDGLFHSAVVVAEGDADCRYYSAVLDDLYENGNASIKPDDVLFVPSGGKDRAPNVAAVLKTLSVKTFAIVDFDMLRDRAKLKKLVEGVGGAWGSLDSLYIPMANALNASDGKGWADVKDKGLIGVPSGSPSKAAHELLERLATQRVLIVPVGELEGFDRTITGERTIWVNRMLEKQGHKTCAAAKELIKLIK